MQFQKLYFRRFLYKLEPYRFSENARDIIAIYALQKNRFVFKGFLPAPKSKLEEAGLEV